MGQFFMPSETIHEAPVNIDIVVPQLLEYEKNTGQKGLVDSCSEEESEIDEGSYDSPSHQNLQAFKDSLNQLECHIKWDAVAEQFTIDRETWQEQLHQTDDIRACARLLVEFYRYIRQEFISDPEYLSGEWLDQFQSPDIDLGTLCGLLLELEETLVEGAFTENWMNMVDRWREGLESIDMNYF